MAQLWRLKWHICGASTHSTQRNRAQTAPPYCPQTRLKSHQKTTPQTDSVYLSEQPLLHIRIAKRHSCYTDNKLSLIFDPKKTRNLQLIYFRDVWFATFLVQFDTFIEFGLNVSDCYHEILPNALCYIPKFYPRPPKIYTD